MKRVAIWTFREECGLLFWDDTLLQPQGEISEDEWKELYPVIQSYLYNNELGRSRTFQAIFAFSRSMTVLLFGLPILYAIHFIFSTDRVYLLFSREPKYLAYFPTFWDFYEATLPLCILGALLFLYSSYKYKRFFVQYLISDFISLRREK